MVDELKLGSDLTGDVPVTHMLLAILNQLSSQKGNYAPEQPECARHQSMKCVARVMLTSTRLCGKNGGRDGLLDRWLLLHLPVDRPLSRRFGLRQVWGKCAVRTFDLASAYRQVGLKASGLPISGFTTPGRRRHVFQESGLALWGHQVSPFLLRPARALWWLSVVGCCILWTSSYDDFIAFSRPKLVGSTEKSVTALFKLLG